MKPHRIALVLLAAAVLWGGYRAYRAHNNLVTLNVREMEVRKVVSKLEWQTWERIIVSRNVGGKVTLNVHSVPLEEVLNIIGLQTDSRWTRLYPVYLSRTSMAGFRQVLEGKTPPETQGWIALQQLAAWQQAGLAGFANTLRAENKLVSAQLVNKDLSFTALALSRFSKAQVVPEDRIRGTVNLTLQQVPFEKAVSKVARQVHAKWDRIYTLQPLSGAMVVRKTAPPPDSTGTNLEFVVQTNQVASTPDQPAIPPETALEALVSTMSPEERQQTMEQVANASQAAGMSPAERQQAMQAGGPMAAAAAQAAQQAQADMESRIETRLKDGTVDQRLAHDRRVLASKQAGQKK